MSGHSKWSKIKHKKAQEDAKKSRVFSKFSKLISLESKNAEGDTDAPALRTAIERAKAVNMPSQNIERAVKKGMEKDSSLLQGVVYEAYGPGSSALIIYGLTDNKNRTSSELRRLLSEHNTSLAEQGAAAWAFERKGNTWVPHTTMVLSPDEKTRLDSLISSLEGLDDVQEIYHNAR